MLAANSSFQAVALMDFAQRFPRSIIGTLPSLPRLNVDKCASLPLANIVSPIIEHSRIWVALKSLSNVGLEIPNAAANSTLVETKRIMSAL